MGEEGSLAMTAGKEASPAVDFLIEEALREDSKRLFEYMVNYNESEYAGWTAGESWSLGDSPAVGVVLEPNCGKSVWREAPIMNEDTSCRFEPGRPMIKVYTSINSRFILEDFMCKLELVYGK